MDKLKTIIIEDEELIRILIKKIMENFGCEVIKETESFEESVDMIKCGDPDLVIIDINLKGQINGMEAALQLRKFSDIPIVLTSAIDYVDYESVIKKYNIEKDVYFIEKSYFKEKIIRVIDKIRK